MGTTKVKFKSFAELEKLTKNKAFWVQTTCGLYIHVQQKSLYTLSSRMREDQNCDLCGEVILGNHKAFIVLDIILLTK